MIGILLALSAALCWGTATFAGGYSTRLKSPFHVLVISAFSGALILVPALLIWKETIPSFQGILWSLLAGLVGAIGVASLYRGLSLGNSATVAPTAAVIGCALPVCFTMFTHGVPPIIQIFGFLLAFLGIWMVTRSDSSGNLDFRRGFFLACLAGICLGCFLIFISQVDPGKVIIPLILARGVTFIAALFLLRANHLPFPQFKNSSIILLAGILDSGGDVLFLLAKQFIRLDTIVIVSSLNSAVVVILTSIFLKEKISHWQKVGVVSCLLSIILISL